jgi:teichuronic acid biosynthesis glycosyltransferase TuaG
MPAYNGEKYIDQAINSILEQTYSTWELLIVNDGSTDKTESILEEFRQKDPRIKVYLLAKNRGKPSIAKNIALQETKGKYIAFLDSDDLWMSEKLQRQVTLMEEHTDIGLTYTGGYWIDQDNQMIKTFLPQYPDGMNLKNMLTRYELNNQSVMITKEALNNTLQFFNEKILIGEDYNLFMHIIAAHKTASIKEYLIGYRIHEMALTKSKKQISDGVLITLAELHNTYGIFWKYPLLSLLTYAKAIRFKYFTKRWM